MEATKKAPEIENLLSALTGRNRAATVANGGCVFCGDKANLNFKDDLSVREYQISGMCQNCQDEVF